jgi:hypothetical protein
VARRLEDYIAELPAAEQIAVEARAAALTAEHAAHTELRRALRRRSADAAARLKTTPAGVAKMERRVDAYVLALREALAAAGGTLEIVAHLPDRAPVPIGQFEGLLGATEPRPSSL